MAQAYGWDITPLHMTVPDPGDSGGEYGPPFSVPKGASTMAIFVPELDGLGATLKLQAMDPQTKDVVTGATWRDVYVFDLTDGTTEALDGIPESQMTTLPVSATGGGVLRLFASTDLSAISPAPKVTITFSREN